MAGVDDYAIIPHSLWQLYDPVYAFGNRFDTYFTNLASSLDNYTLTQYNPIGSALLAFFVITKPSVVRYCTIIPFLSFVIISLFFDIFHFNQNQRLQKQWHNLPQRIVILA